METIDFHIAHTKIFLRTTSFRIQGLTMNNLTLIKIVLGVQGNLNWMPGYFSVISNWLKQFFTDEIDHIKYGI